MAKANNGAKQDKQLGKLMSLVTKQCGEGSVMNLQDADAMAVKTFSTGSITLDSALGVGGLPRGRVIEIYGPEASGKTTLTLHAIAEVQREGGLAAFIDAEHALDMSYAQAIGVDPARLLVSQPDSGEQALDIADLVARSGEADLIVVDSVAALTPKAELDGEMSDQQVGLQARMMGKALRKLTASANATKTTVIFINQLRQKIGVTFGSGETTTGGNALKFYSSVRLDIRRIQTLKGSDGEAFGNRARVKVAKNKVSAPYAKIEFDIMYGRGICRPGELIDLGCEHGIIDKAGAWLSWGDKRLGQGRERARAALLEDAAMRAALEVEVRRAIGLDAPEQEAPKPAKAA